MQYGRTICRRCNNHRTSSFDAAYDQLSDWFSTQQSEYGLSQMDLAAIFGPAYPKKVTELRRYFAKSLGCRIVASGQVIPRHFPDPLSGRNLERLQVSICRSEPFRDLDSMGTTKYESQLFEEWLGKGELYASQTRSHDAAASQQIVSNAVWWENNGHFQINYWFNIPVSPQFGDALDGSSSMYLIQHSELGLEAMRKAMWAWIHAH